MTNLIPFAKELEHSIGKKIKLRINNNRSTMLSVRWEPGCTSISLHHKFLEAPQEVKEHLKAYLKDRRTKMSPALKAFITDKIETLDYSHIVDPKQLVTQGEVYDLQMLYDAVNYEYFDNSLNLHVTWFGQAKQRTRSRVTFGLYCDQLRLVKIHRRLDNHKYPEYFVTYVVYHEMLHHVCRPYVDVKGRQLVHTKEFKEKEKLFRYYDLATHWLKQHQKTLFEPRRGYYGWT